MKKEERSVSYAEKLAFWIMVAMAFTIGVWVGKGTPTQESPGAPCSWDVINCVP